MSIIADQNTDSTIPQPVSPNTALANAALANAPGSTPASAVSSVPAQTVAPQQSAPAPAQSTQRPSLFRRLLSGALMGLGAGLEGTTPQALMLDQARTAQVQAQTQAAANQQDIERQNLALNQQRFQLAKQEAQQNASAGKLQLALLQLNIQKAQRQLALLPVNQQEQFENDMRPRFLDLVRNGAQEIASFDNFAQAQSKAHDLMSQNKNLGYVVGPSVSKQGAYSIYQINQGKLTHDTKVNVGGQKITLPAGTSLTDYADIVFGAARDDLNSRVQQHAQTLNRQASALVSQINSLRQNAAKIAVTNPKLSASYASKADALANQLNTLLGVPPSESAPSQPTQSGMVRVQIPGQPVGAIPQSALAQFQKDHPDAKVIQ